jgi:large subunit ribosomal protein L6
MSRIGKLPILIPRGVEIKILKNNIQCKGPKGTLNFDFDPRIGISKDDSEIKVFLSKDKKNKALWGVTRQLISNMILGITSGFEKKLEVIGIGFRTQTKGNKLVLNVGFTHPIEIEAPKDIKFQVAKNTITILGIDKQLVGQVAAKIRSIKVPEPYKGKGIRYVGEHVRKKAGKKAATVASA